ncbi:MAG: ABC transporter permease [Syntrophales bacterium]|jgi:ABC-type antimicrobial peptide transport system permease subunit|nr:ABC transporter permease [Syntrophales bacterium]NLN60007.1 ABC transporter permease [Deltaproteobacteria bacterium]
MLALISYSLRNLWARRLTTTLTVSGMALVVFVFAAILMLARGLEETLIKTGSYDNAIVIRKGSVSEVQSGIERSRAAIVSTLPGIAFGREGVPLVLKEVLVLISLPKRYTGNPSHVSIRGTTNRALLLRPQVKLVAGRLPRPGSNEMLAGASIARRFKGGGLYEELYAGMRHWQIVGIFDAGNSGFNSEIWADVDQVMQAFRRPVYSSITFKLRNAKELNVVKKTIETDPRLDLEMKRETRYYEEQSEIMAKFLRILGISLTVIFSLGAIIGAMITMYASVATRTAEIGTLRALGFGRRHILAAFLMESLLLGLFGGCMGLFCAGFMQFLTISTINFQTFSELAFRFTLTPDIAAQALTFSLIMGFLGGFLPAFRASRMIITEALRAV